MNLLKTSHSILILLISLTFLNSAAAQSSTDGLLDTTFVPRSGVALTGGLGIVYDGAVLPDGRFLIGGRFQSVNGVAANCVARFLPDGNYDLSFASGLNGENCTVRGLDVQADGKILIRGFGGVSRLNADGTVDNSYAAVTTNNTIHGSAVQSDGKLLIAGDFTSVNNANLRFLVRINTDGTPDDSFNPNNNVVDWVTYAVAVAPGDKIIVAGNFDTAGGAARKKVARLNSDGSLDASFASLTQIDGGIFKILLQPDGKVLLAGNFSQINNQPRPVIARLNADGSLDAGFQLPNGASQVFEDLTIQPDGKIVVVGAFTQIGGVQRSGIARLNPNGTVDQSFGTPTGGASGTINTVLINADKIVVGGSFTGVGGGQRNGFARLLANGALDNDFSTPGANNTVREIAVQTDNRIVIGGDFTSYNGVAVNRIARLSEYGSLDPTFNSGTGFDGATRAIALQSDGKILVGGSFANYNGAARNNLARLNPNGSLDSSFQAEATGAINAIFVQPDGKIIIGGAFVAVNSTSRSFLARLSPNGSLDEAFNPALDGEVSSIGADENGNISIAGNFQNAGGAARRFVARLRENGALDTGFNPPQPDGAVSKLLVQPNGEVLIAGRFQTLGGVSRRAVARLKIDGNLDAGFAPPAAFNATAINDLVLQFDGSVVVGGEAMRLNQTNLGPIARLNFDGSFDSTYNTINRPNNTVEALALQPDGKILVGGSFTALNASAFAFNRIARLTSVRPPQIGRVRFDFDGDGKADTAVFRPSTGAWYFLRSGSNNAASGFSWGLDGDKIVPADYDNDRRTDFAVFRNGFWYILNSSNNQLTAVQFGLPTDIPVPADYDGDGKADICVFRPSNGAWYRINSFNGQFVAVFFGTSGDVPVPADFDGDSRADIAVFRPSNGTWYRLNNTGNNFTAFQFGTAEDKPVPADYDADGQAEYAVFRPSNGTWYGFSQSSGFAAIQFGTTGDIPAPADYDGDGATDIAVFRPSNGTWYFDRTTAGFAARFWGTNGDVPVPAAFVP
jgi:uncharacterized delta-60 repeat protein